VGEISKLKEKFGNQTPRARIGMAHTRWATHGKPSERNALPIATHDGALVIAFNGIVENHIDLRRLLVSEGFFFHTDNDAETLLLWIAKHYEGDLPDAIRKATPRAHGRFAFALMHKDHPNMMVAFKRGLPLIVGRGSNGTSIASDILALPDDVKAIHYIQDETIVILREDATDAVSNDGRPLIPTFVDLPTAEKKHQVLNYETFTLQEILTQPTTISDGVMAAIESRQKLEAVAKNIDRVTFIACGTAYYASMIGKSLVERFAGIPSDANLASEFHSAPNVLDERTLTVFVSQSGETADTLACLDIAKRRGCVTLVISNVLTSTMAREADMFLPIACGPEVGVASTKAYTGMLLQSTFMALAIGVARGFISQEVWNEHLDAAKDLPRQIDQALRCRSAVDGLANSLRERRNFAFIGRNEFYAMACEGALKLRELSYRNAEGFAGGELKHGTLALIEPGYPVIAVAPRVRKTEKIIGNIQEVRARGGRIIGIISEDDTEAESVCDEVIKIPSTLPALMPILAAIPLQLFAYELAKTLGRNIDRPRNLAKSVTVE
jgi:glucosamine--fructose-6-phosphate aminotransferase (isomerizing)